MRRPVGRIKLAPRSPAIAVAVLALVVAAAGGAYAASSGGGTIVACVHHSGGGLYRARKCARHDTRLQWSVASPRGPQGPPGAAGQQGTQGIQGPAGPFPTTLPTGATITGTFAVAGGASPTSTGSDWGYATISFPYPLATPPAAHYMPIGSSPTAACPGAVAHPTATSGNLCVYEGVAQGAGSPEICTPTINGGSGCPGQASRAGAIVRVFESASSRWVHAGTWAVTG